MARLVSLPHLPLLLLLAASCASSGESSDVIAPSPVVLAEEAGVPLTMPPYTEVHTQWKERLAQPYVYFEHHGPREDFGATMRSLLEYTVRRHVETNGPPFGLFGGEGFMRACLPVAQNPGQEGLPFAVLPQAMVVYAVVSGPYPDATLALPGLQQSMAKSGGQPRGAVREIYLVNPAEVATYSALATEVQVAWVELP
jgi:hypothetical protein